MLSFNLVLGADVSSLSKVVWYEGMPLMPHHFQQQDRYFHAYIAKFPNILAPYNWGLQSLKLDSAILKAGKLSLISASGFFPDGTAFDFPQNDSLPLAIDIPLSAKDLTVYLAIPQSRLGLADTDLSKQGDSKMRYHCADVMISDQTVSNNVAEQEIQLGKLNLRLITDNDPKHYFTCIPVCKVKKVTAEKEVILDDDFIPSCLSVAASEVLARFVDELTALLQSRADALAQQVKDITNCGMSELKDFLILQRLNYYQAQIMHCFNKKTTHPEQLFTLLVSLMAEFSTYTELTHRPISIPSYDHECLQLPFTPLFMAIRESLSKILEQNSLALVVEQKNNQLFVATLDDAELLDTAKFILIVNSDLQEEKLKALVPKQVKVAPADRIKNYVMHAVQGLSLRYIAIPPRQLPASVGGVYYEIDKHLPLWESLKNSPSIAIHFNGIIPGLKVELWAVKGT